MADLRTLRPVKKILSDVVAADLRKALEHAIASGATGYVFAFSNGEQYEMAARINAPEIRGFIGFIEAEMKPGLIKILQDGTQ